MLNSETKLLYLNVVQKQVLQERVSQINVGGGEGFPDVVWKCSYKHKLLLKESMSTNIYYYKQGNDLHFHLLNSFSCADIFLSIN